MNAFAKYIVLGYEAMEINAYFRYGSQFDRK